MERDNTERFRGGRMIPGPPMVPGMSAATARVPLTDQEAADVAARVRAAAEQPGAQLRVAPAPARPWEGPETWERVLASLKDILVIVTCLAVLYTLYQGYVALGELQDGLEQLSTTWGK